MGSHLPAAAEVAEAESVDRQDPAAPDRADRADQDRAGQDRQGQSDPSDVVWPCDYLVNVVKSVEATSLFALNAKNSAGR
jgi:hypothetical protein